MASGSRDTPSTSKTTEAEIDTSLDSEFIVPDDRKISKFDFLFDMDDPVKNSVAEFDYYLYEIGNLRHKAGVSPKPIQGSTTKLRNIPPEKNSELQLAIERMMLCKSFGTAAEESADDVREQFRKMKADLGEYRECGCRRDSD